MRRGRAAARGALVALLCIAFAGWAAKPDLAQLPKLTAVLEDQARMVAEHGHAHGVEEDIFWALHGHPHDAADHEHGTEILPSVAATPAAPGHGRAGGPRPARDGPMPVFRLERPPRA